MSELDAMLADLGRVESTGVFTLETSRARALLRRYQLTEPHSYVVLLVSWAVASGAQQIQVGLTPAGLALVHDGEGLGADELRGLFSTLLVEGSPRPHLRLLALGVNAALNLPTRRLVVRSWRDGEGWAARYETDDPHLEPVSGKPGCFTGLELAYWRPDRLRARREEELLAQQFALCPAALTVNGVDFRDPVDFGDCTAQLHLVSQRGGPGVALKVRLTAAFTLHEEHPAHFSALLGVGCPGRPELILLVQGRQFVLPLPWGIPGWGARVVVACDRLQLDLAQEHLVEDQVYHNLVQALWARLLKLVVALGEAIRQVPAERLRHALPALDYAVDLECRAGEFAHASALLERMGAVWEDVEDPVLQGAWCHKLALVALRAGDSARATRLDQEARRLERLPATQQQYTLPDGETMEARFYRLWLRFQTLDLLQPQRLTEELERALREAQTRRRYREALRFNGWLLERDETPERWLVHGGLLAELSAWDRARGAYRQALQLGPAERTTLMALLEGLALVEERSGHLGEAVDLLERCLTLRVESEGQNSPRLHPLLLKLADRLSEHGAGERATQLRAWASHLPQR